MTYGYEITILGCLLILSAGSAGRAQQQRGKIIRKIGLGGIQALLKRMNLQP